MYILVKTRQYPLAKIGKGSDRRTLSNRIERSRNSTKKIDREQDSALCVVGQQCWPKVVWILCIFDTIMSINFQHFRPSFVKFGSKASLYCYSLSSQRCQGAADLFGHGRSMAKPTRLSSNRRSSPWSTRQIVGRTWRRLVKVAQPEKSLCRNLRSNSQLVSMSILYRRSKYSPTGLRGHLTPVQRLLRWRLEAVSVQRTL